MIGFKYRPDIDGLRAFAVILVILFHAGVNGVSGGFIGVDIFFVISGYLITSIIQANIIRAEIQGTHFSFKNFYIRRIKRLLPAYILVSSITTIIAFSLLLPDDLKYYMASLGSSYLGLSNIFFSSLSGGYFSPRMDYFPLLHTWSLSVEEQYYMIWPIFLWFTYRLFKKNITWFLVVFLIFFVILSIYGTSNNPRTAYYLLQYRAFELLIGSLLALSWHKLPVFSRYFTNIIAFIALGCLIGLGFFLSSNALFPGLNAFYVSIATVVLIYTGKDEKSIVNQFLSLKPIVSIGLMSYSLYLWHWPLFSLMLYRQIEFSSLHTVLAIILVFFLSWLSVKFVENPARQSKILTFKPLIVRYYLIPIFVIGLLSVFVFTLDGIPQRYDTPMQKLVASYSTDKDLSRHCSTRFSDFDGEKLTLEYIVDHCSFGIDEKKIPEILLLGDSHANHFKPFVDILAKNSGLRAVYHVQGACQAVNGVANVNDRNNCALHNKKLLSYAKHFKYVILGGYWSSRKDLDGFKKDLEATIKKIIAHQSNPVIFIDNPDSKVDKSKCPVFSRLGWNNKDCLIPLAEVKKTHQPYDQAIIAAQEKYPELVIINPKKLLCDDLFCQTEMNNIAIYKDKNHLNKDISMLLAMHWMEKYGNPLQEQ